MCTHSMRHGHDLCPYLRPWRLKAGNHQENRSSVFHWVVRKGGGSEADFYLLSFPISVCNLPSSIFSNRHSLTHTYTHTHTDTHTLGSLCSEYLPCLITQKSKKKGDRKQGKPVFSMSSFLFLLFKWYISPKFWSWSVVGSLHYSVANYETETSDLRSWSVICCTRQTFLIGA